MELQQLKLLSVKIQELISNISSSTTFTCSRIALLTSELQRVGNLWKRYMHFCIKCWISGFKTSDSFFFKSFFFFKFATLFGTFDYIFDLIFALLTFGDKGVRSRAFPKVKKSCGMCKISHGFKMSRFLNGKHFLTNSLINS